MWNQRILSNSCLQLTKNSKFVTLFHLCFLRCFIPDLCYLDRACIDSFSFLQLTGLTEADKGALEYVIKAARIMDDIFHLQVVLVCKIDVSLHTSSGSQVLLEKWCRTKLKHRLTAFIYWTGTYLPQVDCNQYLGKMYIYKSKRK